VLPSASLLSARRLPRPGRGVSAWLSFPFCLRLLQSRQILNTAAVRSSCCGRSQEASHRLRHLPKNSPRAILRLAESVAQKYSGISALELHDFTFVVRRRKHSRRDAAKFQFPAARAERIAGPVIPALAMRRIPGRGSKHAYRADDTARNIALRLTVAQDRGVNPPNAANNNTCCPPGALCPFEQLRADARRGTLFPCEPSPCSWS